MFRKQEKKSFSITSRDAQSRARTGILRTPHGVIKTPAYVIVATHGSVKALKPSDIKKAGTQVVIANTYHLWDKVPKKFKIQNLKFKIKDSFLIRKLGVQLPTMTDSGGFQLFSFGAAREQGVGKVLQRKRLTVGEKSAVTITEKGVSFFDGPDAQHRGSSTYGSRDKPRLLTPELSMKIQERIGADIIFALDECTSPLHSFVHNKKALERTNRWAKRSLKFLKSKSMPLSFK